jgi:hypothetical protein
MIVYKVGDTFIAPLASSFVGKKGIISAILDFNSRISVRYENGDTFVYDKDIFDMFIAPFIRYELQLEFHF